jgi:hypothetical protein
MYRSLLDFSLTYSRLGWHVYPVWSVDEAGYCWCRGDKRRAEPVCPDAGKHPLPSKDFPAGFQSATTDPDAIRRGWKGTANVGMNPGRSGLVVVDVEQKGLAEWDRVVTGRGLSATLTAVTGGGGLHAYFAKPEGVGRVASPCGLWPGIDIRADDSGLVLPPSRSGKGEYRWLTPEDHPIAVCPGWVLEAIRGADGGKPGPKADRPSTARISVPAAVPSGPEADDPFVFVVGGGELDGHPGSPDGERRETFLRLAGTQLRRGDDPDVVREAGYRWADRCTPPWDHRKVDHHIEGMVRKQGRDTVTTPPPPPSREPAPEPGKEGTIPPVPDPAPGTPEGDSSFLPSGVTIVELDGPGLGEGLVPSFLPSPAPAAGVMGGRGEVVAGDPDPSPDSGVTITELDGSELAVPAQRGSTRPGAGQGEGNRPTLPDAAYHGLFGDMLRAVAPETEADPAGVLVSWLTLFGNAVGRGAWVEVGPRRHYPALFTAVVGKTSDAKGDSWAVARWPFARVDPDWERLCVCPGVGSGEGLVERVADEQRVWEPDKRTGELRERVIPGAADKRCLLRLSELTAVFKRGRREGSSLSEMLREAWDGDPLAVPNRKANALSAAGYTVGVVGDVTPDALTRTLDGGLEAVDGSANRFLWCLVTSPRSLPSGGDIGVLTPFLPRLAEALGRAKGAGGLRRDGEAEALWEARYDALKRSGDAVPHTDRGRPNVVRLALIYALADGANAIRRPHLEAALAVWDYCRGSAAAIFGRPTGPDRPPAAPAAEPSLAERLHALITATPGVKKSELTVAVRNRAKADAVGKALDWLAEAGMAHPGKCQSPNGGPPAECWWPGAGDAVTTLPPLPLEDPEPGEVSKQVSNYPPPGRAEPGERVPSAGSKQVSNYPPPADGERGAGAGGLVTYLLADGGPADDRGGGEGVVTASPEPDVPLTADAFLEALTAPVGGDAKASGRFL